MLKEILSSNLKVVFVGTVVPDFSNDVGFYYMHQRNKFWELLEYSGIVPSSFFPEYERKALRDTFASNRLTEQLQNVFFMKKEGQLNTLRIGFTDLNRRITVSNDDDEKAMPIESDVKQFISKMERLKPKVIAFVTSLDIFVECFKPFYPQATKIRGRQDFKIGESDVWLLGSTSGRPRKDEEREQVFDDLAALLSET